MFKRSLGWMKAKPGRVAALIVLGVAAVAVPLMGGLAGSPEDAKKDDRALAVQPYEDYVQAHDYHFEANWNESFDGCPSFGSGMSDWHNGHTYVACGIRMLVFIDGKLVKRNGMPELVNSDNVQVTSHAVDVAVHSINSTNGVDPAPGETRYAYYGDLSDYGIVKRMVSTGANPGWKLDTGFKLEKFRSDTRIDNRTVECWWQPQVRFLATDGWGNLYLSSGLWGHGLGRCYTTQNATSPRYVNQENPLAVLKYSPAGKLLNIETGFGNDKYFDVNAGIATDFTGDRIFISEIPSNHKVSLFKRDFPGTHQYSFSKTIDSWVPGTAACAGHNTPVPYDIGTDVHSHLYVLVASSCNRIQKYTPDGDYIGKYQATQPGLAHPHGIAVDWKGTVYISQFIAKLVRRNVASNIADVCPNIAGAQNSVAAGKTINAAGDCVDGVAPVNLLRAFYKTLAAHAVTADTAAGRTWMRGEYQNFQAATEGKVMGGLFEQFSAKNYPRYITDASFPVQGDGTRRILADGMVYPEEVCGTKPIKQIWINRTTDRYSSITQAEIDRAKALYPQAGGHQDRIAGWAFPPSQPPYVPGEYVKTVYNATSGDHFYSASPASIIKHRGDAGYNSPDPFYKNSDPHTTDSSGFKMAWFVGPDKVLVPKKGAGICVDAVSNPAPPVLTGVDGPAKTDERRLTLKLQAQDFAAGGKGVSSSQAMFMYRVALNGSDINSMAWKPVGEFPTAIDGLEFMVLLPGLGEAASASNNIQVQVMNSVGLKSAVVTKTVELKTPDVVAPRLTSVTMPGTVETDEVPSPTLKPFVPVTVAADDEWGVTEMRMANGDGEFGAWKPFVGKSNHQLDAVPYVPLMKRVFVQVRDAKGNESNIVSATTTVAKKALPVDDIAPDLVAITLPGEVVYPDGPSTTKSPSANVTIDAKDNMGVTEMRFANGDGWFGDWKPFAKTSSHKLAPSPVLPLVQRVYVQVRDARGNESPVKSSTFLAVAAPTPPPDAEDPKLLSVTIPVNITSLAAPVTTSATDNVKVTEIDTAGSNDDGTWKGWRPWANVVTHNFTTPKFTPIYLAVTARVRDARQNESTYIRSNNTIYMPAAARVGVLATGVVDQTSGNRVNSFLVTVKAKANGGNTELGFKWRKKDRVRLESVRVATGKGRFGAWMPFQKTVKVKGAVKRKGTVKVQVRDFDGSVSSTAKIRM